MNPSLCNNSKRLRETTQLLGSYDHDAKFTNLFVRDQKRNSSDQKPGIKL